MAFARYRASGRISPRFAVGAAAAIVGAAVLAWPYQKLIGWIPYIYLNLLIYLGAALAVGFLAALASKWGQNRNALVGALLGALVGATLVATSHYVAYRTVVDDVVQQLKEHGLSEGAAERAVGDTLTFGRYVDLRLHAGWSLGSSRVPAPPRIGAPAEHPSGDISGGLVWAVWGIEAAGLVLMGTLMGGKHDPFCEACQEWMRDHHVGARNGDPDSVAAATRAETVDALAALPPVSDAPLGPRLAFRAHTCARCQGPAYLTIARETFKPGKDGTIETSSSDLRSHLVVRRDELAALSRDGEPVSARG